MKFHLRLFQILVLLLPVQLGLHFWPAWATVFGIRIDYLAPKIYLTDVIVILLLAAWRFKHLHITRYTLLFLAFAVVNILGAARWQVALVWWLKYLEIGLLAYYVSQNWREIKKWVSKPLAIAISYTTLLAVWQLFVQKTIGGPFWFFGERTFAANTPGIALVDLFGYQIMRPYAAFGHPNQMAGFALAAAPVLGLPLVILSFSRSAILAAGIIGVIFLFRRKLAGSLKYLPLLTIIFSLLLPILATRILAMTDNLAQSVDQRLVLASKAGELFGRSPLVGVGLGNFIPASLNRQPVHNIFLLVATETGVVGLFLLSYFLIMSFRNSLKIRNWKLVISILAILLIGLADHYWLTLQQTQLLFGIVIGASLSKDA